MEVGGAGQWPNLLGRRGAHQARSGCDLTRATDCLDAETLRDLAEGRIASEHTEAVEAHLVACRKCLAVVATSARNRASSGDGGLGDTILLERSTPGPRGSTHRLAIALSLGVLVGSAALWVGDSKPARTTNVMIRSIEDESKPPPANAQSTRPTSESRAAVSPTELATPPAPRIAPLPPDSQTARVDGESSARLPKPRAAAGPKRASDRRPEQPTETPRADDVIMVDGRRIRTTF